MLGDGRVASLRRPSPSCSAYPSLPASPAHSTARPRALPPSPRCAAPRRVVCPALRPPAQNLYETVRTERNLCSRNLMNAQEINGELRRKFHIMEHQVEQLSEEIKAKDIGQPPGAGERGHGGGRKAEGGR